MIITSPFAFFSVGFARKLMVNAARKIASCFCLPKDFLSPPCIGRWGWKSFFGLQKQSRLFLSSLPGMEGKRTLLGWKNEVGIFMSSTPCMEGRGSHVLSWRNEVGLTKVPALFQSQHMFLSVHKGEGNSSKGLQKHSLDPEELSFISAAHHRSYLPYTEGSCLLSFGSI